MTASREDRMDDRGEPDRRTSSGPEMERRDGPTGSGRMNDASGQVEAVEQYRRELAETVAESASLTEMLASLRDRFHNIREYVVRVDRECRQWMEEALTLQGRVRPDGRKDSPSHGQPSPAPVASANADAGWYSRLDALMAAQLAQWEVWAEDQRKNWAVRSAELRNGFARVRGNETNDDAPRDCAAGIGMDRPEGRSESETAERVPCPVDDFGRLRRELERVKGELAVTGAAVDALQNRVSCLEALGGWLDRERVGWMELAGRLRNAPGLSSAGLRRWIPPRLARFACEIKNGTSFFKPFFRKHQTPRFNFHIDATPPLRADEKTAYISGWCLDPENLSMPQLRLKHFSFTNCFPVTCHDVLSRPDIAAVSDSFSGNDQFGFRFTLTLSPGLNYLLLEAKDSDRWITLMGTSVVRSYRTGVTKEPLWPKNRPLVSVVIPCFNYGRYLRDAVDSVVGQTWRDYEIIVVDDGSDDPETLQVLSSLDTPKTRVIRQKNGKLPKARNTGIKHAGGKYICCLDADDKIAPTYLEKCVFRLETGGLDVCGSWQQNFGDDDSVIDPGFSMERLLAMEENCLTVASVFRKSMWKSVGGYDESTVDGESMLYGYEDWDFWVRLGRAGARVAVIGEPLFLYRKHGKSMIDRALEKHDEIVSRIRNKHRAILEKEQDGTPVPHNVDPKETVNIGNLFRADAAAKKKPITILLTMPFLIMGGAEVIMSRICRYLAQRGFRFIVVTTVPVGPGHGDTTHLFEEFTREIFHLPRFCPESRWKGFIFYLLKSRKPDILWQVGSSYVYPLMPEIKTCFPMLKIIDLLFNTVGHTAHNREYNYCIDLHVVESAAVKEWLLDNGSSEDRVRVISNGVDTERFKPQPRVTPPLEAIREDSFVIGFFGRFSEEKGPDLFVDVAGRLKGNSRIKFIMAGVGPMFEEIEQKIRAEGLEESVFLVGYVRTRDYLPGCDVVLLPSRLDGRPNVLLEAMAMGIPAIASRVGGVPEIVEDGVTGFLCDPSDVECFVRKIQQFVSAPALLEGMKINSRRKAESDLDLRKAMAEYEEMLSGLAGPAGNRRVHVRKD